MKCFLIRYFSYTQNVCTRIDSAQISILSFEEPPLVAGVQVICEGEVFDFRLPAGWDQLNVNGQVLNESQVELVGGNYTLDFSNECESRMFEVLIEEEDCDCPVYVPNAFTPDGDQINEVFKPYFDCDRNYRLSVFNRWGECIYDSERESLPYWNGSVNGGSYYAPADVYVWSLELPADRERYQAKRLRGSVVLIR